MNPDVQEKRRARSKEKRSQAARSYLEQQRLAQGLPAQPEEVPKPKKKKKKAKVRLPRNIPLSKRQARFVDVFQGNASEAARIAGYAAPGVEGCRLLKNKRITEAINNRVAPLIREGVATREDRQLFWSKTMKSMEEKIADRLKASELLGKSQADFTDRVLMGGLEETLKDLDDVEIDRRLRQIESQEAALRLEVGESEETLH